MPREPASAALARLSVLDLTRARAGPTCVKQLADFGADVIKVESPPGLDPNASDAARARNRRALNEELNRALAARTTADWVAALNEAGVPCGPILAMDQVFADPQVRHLGIAAGVKHPALGEIRLLAQAATLARTPATLAAPAPECGEHTEEVLRELGYDAAQVEALRRRQVI